MVKVYGAVLVVLIAVLGGAAAARADMCLDFDDITFVAHGFFLPAKGVCKPLTGERFGFPFAGVACRSSDGDTLRLAFTWYADGSIQHWKGDIPMPAGAGGTGAQWVVSTGGVGKSNRAPVSIGDCNPRNQPIP